MSKSTTDQAILNYLGESDVGLSDAIRKHLMGSCCELLRKSRRIDEATPSPDTRTWLAFDDFFSRKECAHWRPLYTIRREIIEVFSNPEDTPAFRSKLSGIVDDISDAWGSPSRLGNGGMPAVLRQSAAKRGALDASIVFKELAKSHKDKVSEVAYLFENWCYLSGHDLVLAKKSERCWLLLASGEVEGLHGKAQGALARAKIELVPDGCGCVYPNPLSAGYVSTATSFQESLANAWNVVQQLHPDLATFDLRWGIRCEPTEERPLPMALHLSGRSGELALACTIRALMEGRGHHYPSMDDAVAITASFASFDEANPLLVKVGSVEAKSGTTHAMRRHHGVSDILLASGQPYRFESTAAPEAKGEFSVEKQKLEAVDLTLNRVAYFDNAFRLATRWPRLTSHVKQALHEQATKKLDECDPYVPLPISAFVKERENGPGSSSWYRLKSGTSHTSPDSERQRFVQACHYDTTSKPTEPPRYAVLEESGMGKSALTWEFQQEIAASSDERVPVRLEKLGNFDWKSEESVLSRVIDRLCTFFPTSNGGELENTVKRERTDWLRQKIRRGEIVFILDALDQADVQSLVGLDDMIGNSWADCPIVITGRKHILDSRTFVFRRCPTQEQVCWQIFRIDGFEIDSPDLRAFLLETADDLIVGEFEGSRWIPNKKVERKRGWNALLTSPLLANYLRDLARAGRLHSPIGGPAEVKNREQLYHELIGLLIEKGRETVRDACPSSMDIHWEPDEILELLSDVAWESISKGNFSNFSSGEEWKAIRTKLKSKLKQFGLEQINLFTLHSLIENPGGLRVEWRHLSLCEYFAASRLADMGGDEFSKVARQHGYKARWRPTLRFVLAKLDRLGNREKLNDFAHSLIRFCNPWIVWHSSQDDGVRFDDSLWRLCRWLTSQRREYVLHDAFELPPPALSASILSLFSDMFANEPYRDSRCLFKVWELTSESDDPVATEILQRFHAEVRDLETAGNKTAIELLNDDSTEDKVPTQRNWVRCPRDPSDDGVAFRMGATADEGYPEERPQHEVAVSSFRMLSFPITNEQFALFDRRHSQRIAEDWPEEQGCSDAETAAQTTWFQARLFCVWLGEEFRLPTEAEWEFACRAGTASRYGVGQCDTLTIDDANFGSFIGQRTPRATYPPNNWGLYDMHGNSWEWCHDWYDDDEYMNRVAVGENEPVKNPPGPSRGDYAGRRCGRGGAFYLGDDACRSANRRMFLPCAIACGIRPVRT